MTYACSSPSQDDCGPLRARGCSQISSTCKEPVGKSCAVYTQTYQCKTPGKEGYAITGGQTPFCMDGNCRDQSWEMNNEMMSSLAQLSLLKEMQGKLNDGTIFQGEDKRCSKYTASFKDCCKSGKGWSKSIGMGGCGADEKALSQKRNAGLCHYVGTYCDKKEKLTGICLEKKSSFCCFSNKLIKAFHEQGRPQIGLGWGDPKHPLCRGFTVDELQRIDFSKLDLREAFEDIMKDYSPEKISTVGPHIGQRMEVIKKAMRPPTEKQPPQRDPE
jgi:conjugal transfer mating pair stabilization protein TraN